MPILTLLIAIVPFLVGPFQNVRITDQPVLGVLPPFALVHPQPVYTLDALSQRIEGAVTVQVQVKADGDFKVLQVMKGLGHGLDESALAALQQWRFAPALSNGLPVSVIANVDVDFHPSNGEWPVQVGNQTLRMTNCVWNQPTVRCAYYK